MTDLCNALHCRYDIDNYKDTAKLSQQVSTTFSSYMKNPDLLCTAKIWSLSVKLKSLFFQDFIGATECTLGSIVGEFGGRLEKTLV